MVETRRLSLCLFVFYIGYGAPAPTVVVGQSAPILSTEPTVVTCPHCQQSVQTQVTYETGLLTWLGVGGCLLIG